MEDRPSLEDVIEQWRADEGRITPKDSAQFEAFTRLFAIMEGYGYGKNDVKRRTPGWNFIVYHSHPAGYKGAQKWKEQVERVLGLAIARYWPLDGRAAPSPEKLESMKEKEPVYVQQAPSSEPDSIEQTELEPAPETPRAYKEYTQEEWDKIPSLEPEYDPELRKLLGFEE